MSPTTGIWDNFFKNILEQLTKRYILLVALAIDDRCSKDEECRRGDAGSTCKKSDMVRICQCDWEHERVNDTCIKRKWTRVK